MRRIALAVSVIVALAALAGQAQDGKAILEAASRALGATNLTSIQYSGTGNNAAYGQGYTPGGPWAVFKVTSYTAAVNYATPAMRIDLDRDNPDGVKHLGGGGLPILAPQKQITVVSGNFAWNVNGQNAAPSPGNVQDRLRAIWLTPHGVIKAAQNAGASTVISMQRGADGKSTPVITFPANGLNVQVTLNADNLVERIQSRVDDNVLGDRLDETVYSNYRDFGGVKFPMHIVQNQGGYPVLDLTVTDVKPNAPVTIDVPQNVQQAPAPGPAAPPQVVTTKIADGVYHLTWGSPHSIAVEFKDYIVLVDSTFSDERAADVFAAAKQAIPNKPIKYVISTHHHFDHTGGLRYAVSQGAIIITQVQNKEWYERLLSMPHTIRPDALARAPRKAVIETMEDQRVITDGRRRMVIYRLHDFSHVDTMLMEYLPKEKVLIEADAYNPPNPGAPPAPKISPLFLNLYNNITRLKLDVNQIVTAHGPRSTMAELRAAVGKPAVNSTH